MADVRARRGYERALTLPTIAPPQTGTLLAPGSLRPLRLVDWSAALPGGPAFAGGLPAGVVTGPGELVDAAAAAQFVENARRERPRRDVRAYAETFGFVMTRAWYSTHGS